MTFWSPATVPGAVRCEQCSAHVDGGNESRTLSSRSRSNKRGRNLIGETPNTGCSRSKAHDRCFVQRFARVTMEQVSSKLAERPRRKRSSVEGRAVPGFLSRGSSCRTRHLRDKALHWKISLCTGRQGCVRALSLVTVGSQTDLPSDPGLICDQLGGVLYHVT